MKVLDVIKQIQQAIVYIEDRLLEPFNLQDLSDYVGLSPYHLDQSFKMIVGQSPESYAHARKMTAAAREMMLMILVIFMVSHLFKHLQKKMS